MNNTVDRKEFFHSRANKFSTIITMKIGSRLPFKHCNNITNSIKTLDLTVEYMFQLKVYI